MVSLDWVLLKERKMPVILSAYARVVKGMMPDDQIYLNKRRPFDNLLCSMDGYGSGKKYVKNCNVPRK